MASSRDVLARLRPIRLAEIPELPAEPVVPRPAASVLLIRDTAGGLEVWLMRRHATMAFAPGMAVFPGGRMDPIDRDKADPLRACAARELAEETTVQVAADDLRTWAHWITPAIEPKRYDTWFFVARLPDGAQPADVSGEADEAYWVRPAEALRRGREGELGVMRPTEACLIELADLGDTAAVLAATDGRLVEPICPAPSRDDAGWYLGYPQVDESGCPR